MRNLFLKKLAAAPFRLVHQRHPEITSDYAGLLRPIMDDLLRSESYWEMRGPSNAVPEVILGVRLDSRRAELWRTNLSTVLASWTGIAVSELPAGDFSGWELKKHHDPNRIHFFRAGDWVVFGWGENDLRLQPGFLQRIKEKGRPVDPAGNYWLDAFVDWPKLAPYHPLPAPFAPPRMQLTLEGRPAFVRTKLVLRSTEPWGLSLKPWRIPINTIHDPLISFTAVRGVTPWFNQFEPVRAASGGPLPDQFVIWAMAQNPLETCLAAPVANGASFLQRVAPGLTSMLNSNLAPHHVINEAVLTNNEIVVKGFPILAPYLRPIHEPSGDFVLGGLFPSARRKNPAPPELLREVMTRKDLVYYDWEITAERVKQWLNLSRVFLMMGGKQFPADTAPAEAWITAVQPKLGNCATVMTLTAPNELTLVRNSPVGFTGVELVWLAYWLDSAGFPFDAHYDKPVRAMRLNKTAPVAPVKSPPRK